MPIYEYKCENCGRVTENLQKGFKQANEIICPHCGSTKLQKLISTFGSVKKGGFSRKGATCCGRDERCDTPPCSSDGTCRRDK
jgi:putative FmdB family regulatory protein